MFHSFKRPENLSFPQIYHTFRAKDRDSDEIVNYYVQDLPNDRVEEATDLMAKHFLPDETLCSSIGLHKDQEEVEKIKLMWQEMAKEKFSIVCFREGHDDIVAANFLTIYSKNDPKEEFPAIGEKLKAVFELMDIESSKTDVYDMFGVQSYMTALGLCVNTDYRRRGIATEMLKARAPFLKSLGLKVTTTVFTAIGSQKAAALAGYKEIHVRSYEEIGKDFPAFDFSKSATKDIKIMALEIDN